MSLYPEIHQAPSFLESLELTSTLQVSFILWYSMFDRKVPYCQSGLWIRIRMDQQCQWCFMARQVKRRGSGRDERRLDGRRDKGRPPTSLMRGIYDIFFVASPDNESRVGFLTSRHRRVYADHDASAQFCLSRSFTLLFQHCSLQLSKSFCSFQDMNGTQCQWRCLIDSRMFNSAA